MTNAVTGRAGLIRALTVLAVISGGPCAGAQNAAKGPAFPVPRAEKEFAALAADLQGYCGSVTKGDPKAFVIALSAYGPLDLQMTKARSPDETRSLRVFHLGVAAAASQMPPGLAERLEKPFQNAPADVLRRKQRLVKELPQIEALVKQFRAVSPITLLAHWGFADEYRVNDTFHMLGRTAAAVPSPVMGFVPSGRWKPYTSVQEYLYTIHVSQPVFDPLYEAFRPLDIVSVRRAEGGDVEVIGVGVGTDISGLLFTRNGGAGPAVGRRLSSGAKYVDVEKVKPGVFYFETD